MIYKIEMKGKPRGEMGEKLPGRELFKA